VLKYQDGGGTSFTFKESDIDTDNLMEGLTGDLIGAGTDKLIDMGLNKPTANVLNYGLDYINTQIWKPDDQEESKNKNTKSQDYVP
jgi:hypothetical protein